MNRTNGENYPGSTKNVAEIEVPQIVSHYKQEYNHETEVVEPSTIRQITGQ